MAQRRSLLLGVVWGAFATASSVHAQCLFTALSETRHDTSAPLCTLTSVAGAPPTASAAAPPGLFLTTSETDPVLQTSATAPLNAVLDHNIIGLGGNFVGPQGAFTPPGLAADPNGAAGTTQYMQWVNSAVAVFSKSTGAPTCGPIYDPWKGFGVPCEGTSADGIVLFDRMAGRWIIMVPKWDPANYALCFAVSMTSDATGSYYRYAFPMPAKADYPKLGVWPDGYYLSANMYSSAGQFVAGRACAFDRNAMLAGGTATGQCYDGPDSSFLPSDFEGTTPPPPGAPNYFLNVSANSLNLWRVHIDWANPCSSTGFLAGGGGQIEIPVAAYTNACTGSPSNACIPQAATATQLRSWSRVLMHRLAYRNFGNHESLVVTHSVGTPSGIRWYELRDLGLNPPSIYQQGTYAPSPHDRWMGSAAMDRDGDIAIGFNRSSSGTRPSIYYAGRGNNDLPLGRLRASAELINGLGSRSPSSNWGDYASMVIDPVDDCTFWYTNMYMLSDGNFDWGTGVGAFHFPECTAPSDTINAQVVQDTYISSVNPTGNFGTSTQLLAGRQVATGKSSGPLVFETLLHFDLEGWLPPATDVRSAVLWIYGSGNGTPTLSIERLTTSFSEASASWNDHPTTEGVPAPMIARLSPTAEWKAIDITPLAVDCRVNRGGQCYWRLAEMNETDNTFTSLMTFPSKESSPATVPYLRVKYQ